MSAGKTDFPEDKTAPERRRNLTDKEVRDLKSAGGVEGGMQAGSPGGPGANEEAREAEPDEAATSADGN